MVSDATLIQDSKHVRKPPAPMPLSTLRSKVIASSELILLPLTRQSQAEFEKDPRDYGDGSTGQKNAGAHIFSILILCLEHEKEEKKKTHGGDAGLM